MKNKMMLAASAILSVIVAGGVAVAQDTDDDSETGMYGPGMMQGRGMGYGPGMMQDRGRGYGPGMMRGRHMGQHMMGPGMMHGMRGMGMGRGMMRGMGMGPGWRMGMFEQVDANDDGRISADEAETFWTDQMETYDSDGDGTLSLEEFAEMHAAHTRPLTVDRFQAFDEDGDGKVTESELEAPSRRMVRMMERFEKDAAGPGNMRGRRGAGMMREQ